MAAVMGLVGDRLLVGVGKSPPAPGIRCPGLARRWACVNCCWSAESAGRVNGDPGRRLLLLIMHAIMLT